VGTSEYFCGGGLLSEEGEGFSPKKVARKINSAARKNFSPPGLFFYALTFSEKSWVAVGMCAGRLEIPGRDG